MKNARCLVDDDQVGGTVAAVSLSLSLSLFACLRTSAASLSTMIIESLGILQEHRIENKQIIGTQVPARPSKLRNVAMVRLVFPSTTIGVRC